jgi:hypothetical protein
VVRSYLRVNLLPIDPGAIGQSLSSRAYLGAAPPGEDLIAVSVHWFALVVRDVEAVSLIPPLLSRQHWGEKSAPVSGD